jgi:hypothetical protein
MFYQKFGFGHILSSLAFNGRRFFIFQHTNIVHIFEAVIYHTKKKRKTKQSALHTDLVNRHTIFLYFSKCFNLHTKFVNLKF